MWTDQDRYLFREGTHSRLYELLGCRAHADGARFALWAPNAERVSVVGEFNDWDADAHPLAPPDDSGVWLGEVAGARPGQLYKYRVAGRRGFCVDKADSREKRITASGLTDASVATQSAASVSPRRIASTPSWIALTPDAQAVVMVIGDPLVPYFALR